MLEKNRFSEIVCRELHIDAPAPDMTEWDAHAREHPQPLAHA